MSIPGSEDPNEAGAGGETDPFKTQVGGVPDPQKTQLVGPPGTDLGRTQVTGAPGVKALTMEIVPGREFALANTMAREAFLIDLKATEMAGGGRQPLNLCLVIDRSGSMEGEPLEYVKVACGYVVDLLNEKDILSIVTFEEMVEVLMPPRKVLNKDLIKQHIQRIVAGNTTNIYDGIQLGAQQVFSAQEPGLLARLVLLTDGEPTAGIRDFQSIVGQVAELKKQGLTVTALGFGPEYNEELVAGIARRAGGNYYYISRPDLIPEVFRQELQRLMTTVAMNVSMTLKFARWARPRQVYGHDIDISQSEIKLDLPDIEKGTTVGNAVEMDFPNHPAGIYRVCKASVQYDDTVTGRRESVDGDLLIEFTTDRAKVALEPDERVAREIQAVAASRAVEKTLMGMRTQQVSGAAAVAELQKTQALLAGQGRMQEAKEVAQAIRDMQRGDTGAVEKTLIGTVMTLDQGKRTEKQE
jgi:Ca-activated chloride channel family protein